MANKIEMTLLRTLRENETEYNEYRVGEYIVDTVVIDGNIKNVRVNKNWELTYLPEIYCSNNLFKEGSLELKIQTTSYGSLPVEKIQKVIEGYQYAMQIVEFLNEEFINKQNGNSSELTDLEKETLDAITKDCFYENGLDSTLWVDCFMDGCEISSKVLRGVLGSLVKKGIINGIDKGKDGVISFTEYGKSVMAELGYK